MTRSWECQAVDRAAPAGCAGALGDMAWTVSGVVFVVPAHACIALVRWEFYLSKRVRERERRLEAREKQKQAAKAARDHKRDAENAAIEAELARRRAAQNFYDLCRP